MLNNLNIKLIEEKYIKEISDYCFNEWKHECLKINIKNSDEYEIDLRENYLKDDNIPLCLIATYNNILIGSVELVLNDLENYDKYNPWIASLYIKFEYRNLGIGSKLISEIKNKSKKNNIEKLYLWCKNNNKKFYENLGFIIIDETYYCNNLINIMYIKL